MIDKIIIKQLKEGNINALKTIYTEKHKMIFNIALDYVGIKEEAEDILQETFVKIYKNINKFKYEDEKSFDKWIIRICINSSLDLLRKKKREKNFLSKMLFKEERMNNTKINEYNLNNDIEKALKKLSTKQKTIFILKYLEEYSINEISEIMNCSVNTVKKHINRGINKLRKYFNEGGLT